MLFFVGHVITVHSVVQSSDPLFVSEMSNTMVYPSVFRSHTTSQQASQVVLWACVSPYLLGSYFFISRTLLGRNTSVDFSDEIRCRTIVESVQQ